MHGQPLVADPEHEWNLNLTVLNHQPTDIMMKLNMVPSQFL